MTTPAMPVRVTIEDFLRLVDPPGVTTELIDGEVITMPPASTRHSRVTLKTGARLLAFVEEHGFGVAAGEGGYILSRHPATVRAPDVAYISFERLGAPDFPETGYFEGAPNLAVEVVSPEDREQDIQRKIELWLEAGAERVWEVRPRLQAVTVHRRGEAPRTLTSAATLTSDDAAFPVEGFNLRVGDIF